MRVPAGVVAPTREDPLVAAMSPVVGGPTGRRVGAGRHGWWNAVRVLVVLSMAVLALGVVEKQHCRAQGWTTPDQFWHACYSDLPIVYQSAGLRSGLSPYVADGAQLDHPVLTGLTMWAMSTMVPAGDVLAQTRWYFDLGTVLVAVLLVALVGLTAASAGRRRPWDAALVAVCPLIALSALVSIDLLGVTLASAGLLAWARRRPVAAGVLLGLAVAARTYPAVLVLVLGLLALRAGRLRAWAVTAGACVLTTLVVVLPLVLRDAGAVLSTYRSWSGSPAGYGSLWLLPQTLFADPRPRWMTSLGLGPTTWPAGAVTTLAVAGVLLALAAGAALALGARRRPRVAQLAFVVLAIVVITGKSWPVQASLWLLPLAALAHPRWRDHLVWVGTEAAYFVAVWLYIAAGTSADRGLPATWYSVFVLARTAGLLWLVWCVVREIRRPEHDVVRRDGTDDPLGGPLEGAQDAVVLKLV
ncbi:MAG TPA: hypothetical protein VF661_08315 [Actinomycetales bacterium]